MIDIMAQTGNEKSQRFQFPVHDRTKSLTHRSCNKWDIDGKYKFLNII